VQEFADHIEATARRKTEQLDIVAQKDVAFARTTLLEEVQLIHQALPELDFEEIEIGAEFFGKTLASPLLINSMTGGATWSATLNRDLAAVAQKCGIAFAVGSQRIMLRHPESVADFAVRKFIPDGILLGNIGAVQLLEYSPERIVGLVRRIEADGLCIHLNPAQEMIQHDGHRHFRGLTDKLKEMVEILDGRVLIKESGAGLSLEALRLLKQTGARYIDISGAGGTSWTKVESYRAPNNILKSAGEIFSEWGIPTAAGIILGRNILTSDTCLVASGGIRNGLDVARAIALGADMAGIARMVLMAFLESGPEGARGFIEAVTYQLKTAMLLTGARNLKEMRNTPRMYTGLLLQWMNMPGLNEKGLPSHEDR